MKLREIILFIVCLFLAFFLIRGCDTPIDKDKYISKELFDAANDSLHKTRNSLGQEVTKTKLLSGTVADLKNLGSSKDSTIQKLIKLVNKKTIAATVISNTTSNSLTTSTQVVPKDTVKEDSLNVIYPEYKFNKGDTLKNKWEQVYAVANKDSFHFYYKVFNAFNVTQKFERQKISGKLFKRSVAIVEVTNENPRTTTTELKSFVKEMPKQRKGLIFIGGIVTGFIIKQKFFPNKN